MSGNRPVGGHTQYALLVYVRLFLRMCLIVAISLGNPAHVRVKNRKFEPEARFL